MISDLLDFVYLVILTQDVDNLIGISIWTSTLLMFQLQLIWITSVKDIICIYIIFVHLFDA